MSRNHTYSNNIFWIIKQNQT